MENVLGSISTIRVGRMRAYDVGDTFLRDFDDLH